MTIELYYHPFASFCQKAIIAFYEKGVPFEPHPVNLGDPNERAAFAAIWPIAKFPVIRDTGRDLTVAESTIVIEYIDRIGDRPRLIPDDPDRARIVRQWDRVLDNYVHIQMQKIVGDRIRPDGERDPHGVAYARNMLETAFGMLEAALGEDGWLAGEFSLADCAAGPPLRYAQKLTGFGGRYPKLGSYLGRLMARPSFARAIEEARPFRHFFPGGPDDGPWPED